MDFSDEINHQLFVYHDVRVTNRIGKALAGLFLNLYYNMDQG